LTYAFHCGLRGADVGALGVVDESHTVDGLTLSHPVRQSFKLLCSNATRRCINAKQVRNRTGGHHVLQHVTALIGQFINWNPWVHTERDPVAITVDKHTKAMKIRSLYRELNAWRLIGHQWA